MRPLSPLDRSAPPAPARPRAGAGDGFATLFADLAPESDAAATARQAPARPGKRLPVAVPDPAGLSAGLAPPVARDVLPPDLAPPATGSGGTGAVAPPAGDAAATPPVDDRGVAVPASPPPPSLSDAPVAPGTRHDTATATDGATRASIAAAAGPAIDPPRRAMPGEASAPVVALAPAPPPAPMPAPVAMAAMAVAADDPAAPDDRATRRRDDPVALPTAPLADAPPRPVAAAVAADAGHLDTRDDRWMQGMIDHIETLRDDATATGTGETRIRLSPDALGEVEIVIRTGDDGVQVRFASESADAGRLLADAQPRLADLAAARGLKLGGMAVDVGSQRDPSHPPAPPPRPRVPRTSAAGASPLSIQPDAVRIA